MAVRAWLTPDTVPGTLECYQIYIPDSDEFRAAFRGALRLLELPENWEQWGSQTPEAIAQRWAEANLLNYELLGC